MEQFKQLNNYTLNSREVAKMVEKQHPHLLRDIVTYIKYIKDSTNPDLDSLEFFIESTYIDSKGETRPCYDITRKGCEMIANKLTGRKGTLFTASYINRFHAMEEIRLQPPYDTTKAIGIGEIANLTKTTISVMNKQGSPSTAVARQVELMFKQFGIKTIPDFVNDPPYEQLKLIPGGCQS